jgi:hypothetical protein
VNRSETEVDDQLTQAVGHRDAGVVLQVSGGVTEAGEVDGENAVLASEQRDELVKRPPGLGKAMHEHDGGAVCAGADPVQVRAVQPGVVVGDLGD